MEGLVFIKTGIFISLPVFSFFHTTEAQCNETEKPTFGQNCSFFCHCMDNEQCDFTTGNCSKGCDFDWVGPACQRMNIIRIYNKSYVVAKHSSNTGNNKRWANLAIDKNLSSCSYTNYANNSNRKPWWRVWLADKYAIRHISIVTDESAIGNFKGFTVRVGNVSYDNRTNGKFDNSTDCYTHTNSSPVTNTILVTCSKDIIGNQVKIELASIHTQLVLCDVRIYGECQDGTFGETCTERCSLHCVDICDKSNGTCTTCEPRWTGDRCEQCSFNFYGDECEKGCGHCFNGNERCDYVNMKCLNGCEAGWKGMDCDQECDEGKYGQNCITDCSPFCKVQAQCDKRNGSCVNGCAPGFTGIFCNIKCPDGSYGNECQHKCSEYCVKDERLCDNVNGTCLSGCQEGWFGKNCSQECVDGKYGANCNLSCSENCKNNVLCRKDNGTCPYGCKEGYEGSGCFEECENQTYGLNCAFKCSGHCLDSTVCLHINGSCMIGCEPGWIGDTCEDGNYGQNCSADCTLFCKVHAQCDKRNGSCVDGCALGFTGSLCNIKCPYGFYGKECQHNCSDYCVKDGRICDNTNGTCLSGCQEGWFGRNCSQECVDGKYGANCNLSCSENCKNNVLCRKDNGTCPYGCKEGYEGSGCFEECQNQTYGLNCAFNCSRHCLKGTTCLHTNGTCIKGCEPGWTGDKCKDACDERSWGENCQRRCLACHGEKCDRYSGKCYGLCKPGFKQTDYCDQECDVGWFGLNCAEKCSQNCRNVSQCRKSDGLCFWCKLGSEGEHCETVVEETKEAISHCVSEVSIAFSCMLIFILGGFVVRFIIRKRKRKLDSDNDVTVTYTNTLFGEAYETDHAENAYQSIMENNGMHMSYSPFRTEEEERQLYIDTTTIMCSAEVDEMERVDSAYQTIKGKTDDGSVNENVYQTLDDVLDGK